MTIMFEASLTAADALRSGWTATILEPSINTSAVSKSPTLASSESRASQRLGCDGTGNDACRARGQKMAARQPAFAGHVRIGFVHRSRLRIECFGGRRAFAHAFVLLWSSSFP